MVRMKISAHNGALQSSRSSQHLPESPDVMNASNWAVESSLEASPSLKQTRQLESTILDTMKELRNRNHEPSADIANLVSLLNQALTAISHWSLQAQLSQLENRSAWDSRLAVENSIIKKEVEFFRNRCQNEVRQTPEVSSRPGSPSGLTESAKTTKPAKSSIFKKQKSHSISNPSRLRLVENHKSHPRMRRTSDNPAASNFVRVFHLERS
ncbi:LAFA_0G18932g1_1 [Lachancea sp. 'fantastica']|nr:LAFA_0G18932g1_1 [Lachancea sp. 'fantastica']